MIHFTHRLSFIIRILLFGSWTANLNTDLTLIYIDKKADTEYTHDLYIYMAFKMEMEPWEKGWDDSMPNGWAFESTCSITQGAPWSSQIQMNIPTVPTCVKFVYSRAKKFFWDGEGNPRICWELYKLC